MTGFILIFLVLINLNLCISFIFPPPKYQKLSKTQFLQLQNICDIITVSIDNKINNKTHHMFQKVNTNPEYYLKKIIKRKSPTIHCQQIMFPKDEQKKNIISLNIIVDQQKVTDKQGYILKTQKEYPQIQITVQTYSGYVYALQTLFQIIQNKKIAIGIIQDSPLVQYRGIMIDSVRHFLKIQTIRRLVESMPLSRLNMLHWHLCDDQAFTLKLNSHPELAESSAYNVGKYYTIDEVKSLISLAKANGVSIIPQIDTPAHARAWGLDPKWQNQNIVIKCGKGTGYNGQFDLSKQIVYTLAKDVYKQINQIFVDSPYLHLGGDEVFSSCFDLRPSIKQFMKQNNISDYDELQQYWRTQIKKDLPQNRTAIFWRNDAKVTVADNDIIHYWGLQDDIPTVLENSKSKIILSTTDYLYINSGFGNIWFNSSKTNYITWRHIYQNFTIFLKGVDKSRILGAQVTLWGQVSNDDTLQNNLWMRSTVLGYKLWTEQMITLKQFIKGIVMTQNQLIKMNVQPSPIVSQFCQKFTDKCLFQ